MAARRRRRSTHTPALSFLLGAAVLLAGCSAEVNAAGESPAVVEEAAAAVAPQRVEQIRAPLPKLAVEVRAIVTRWIRAAARESKGKASASNVHVAVHVVEPTAGEVLVEVSADRAMRPASNMKLVTTAAALFLLGAQADFVTPIEARGSVNDGRLEGDLVVRACGDPFFDTGGLGRVEERLFQAARTVAASGIRVVSGDLILDEGRFLEPGPGPGWPDPSQHWTEYCARAAGFTLNGGVLMAEVTPGRVGAQAVIALHPVPTGLKPRLGVETIARGAPDVRVGATASTVTVRGKLPVGEPYLADFAHPDPVQLFTAVFEEALSRAGVRIEGETRRARGTPAGKRIAEMRSPVADVLAPINADSLNGVADQLFFALGESLGDGGTREASRRVVEEALRSLGASSAGFHQVDGSGLSWDDRVTARQLTSLIAAVLAREDEAAGLYVESLAVMGERGTLEERLRGTPAEGRVAGKSGWIRGTSALSGVARADGGPALVFSILIDYPAEIGGLNSKVFKPMQDELCSLFVRVSHEAR